MGGARAGEMYRSFPWFHGEGCELLIEDLRALPTDRITVAEGFRLLPELVSPLLGDIGAAVWLLPAAAFRRAAFGSRHGPQAFWARTLDPGRAIGNLLARDAIFTAALRAATAREGLRTVATDGAQSVEALTAAIAEQFGLTQPPATAGAGVG